MIDVPIRILALASALPEDAGRDLTPEQVSPGIGGFLVFFLLGLASWLLYRSFTTHMRRVDVRARREREDARGEDEAGRGRAGEDEGSGPGGHRGHVEGENGADGSRPASRSDR